MQPFQKLESPATSFFCGELYARRKNLVTPLQTMTKTFVINCDTQEEIDYYGEKLTAGGGKEVECGWGANRYGLSW